MSDELKSLKNPTRVLTVLMFIAIFITSVGVEGLEQTLPFIPQVIITGIVSTCALFITQYGTELRVVRAEELKEQEIVSNFEDNYIVDEQTDDNGV